jgi:phosphatidylserine decarboxylase
VLVSPCDAIVGAHGCIDGERLYQIKGSPYTLTELLGDATMIGNFRGGRFITLRLTSSMYHRFHAPYDLTVHNVTYISGDTWNVNPIALKRVENLFCRNERVAISARLEPSGHSILLVPVAAILVASIRLHFIDTERHLRELAEADGMGRRIPRNRDARHRIPCDCRLSKGQEMGWFEHGSTIIVFAPDGFNLSDGLHEGMRIKAGQALMKIPGIPQHDKTIENATPSLVDHPDERESSGNMRL